MSVHQTQQQPVTFTRALEMSKSIGQSLNDPTGDVPVSQGQQRSASGADIKLQNVGKHNPGESGGEKRDSVYDINNYEISV